MFIQRHCVVVPTNQHQAPQTATPVYARSVRHSAALQQELLEAQLRIMILIYFNYIYMESLN